MQKLVIGSRGSQLALWQANWVMARLGQIHPHLTIEIAIIKTTGDKLQSASLAQIGGKGVFTKELEDALIDRRIDLAVHSLKDLPTTLPPGLHLAAVAEREDPRDALIVNPRTGATSIEELPAGARVGTSSLRRAAQLRYARPDLEILELRGNVETRLSKLSAAGYDAIILAAAGLARLGLSERITAYLEPDAMLPAVGQGALGIESRADDPAVNELLAALDHPETRAATEAERAVLRTLGGGCAVPIAAHASVVDERLHLAALVADPGGERLSRRERMGEVSEARALGEALASELIDAGAGEILRDFHDRS